MDMKEQKSESRKERLAEAEGYVRGQGDKIKREQWEESLLSSEDALMAYMEALDEFGAGLPVLQNPEGFAERVMAGLEESVDRVASDVTSAGDDAVKEHSRRLRWYEKPVFHYTVAASITLILLSSGVFDRLLSGSVDVVMPDRADTSSYTEQMMSATSGWLDQLIPSRK